MDISQGIPSRGVGTVYLFLDIDGVLQPMFPGRSHPAWEQEPLCYKPEFEAAVRRMKTSVRIVISSTWRRGRSIEQLRELFSPDIAALVVGATPRIGTGHGLGGRLAEVRQWMDTHAPGGKAVAIDDMPDLYFPGETNPVAVISCPDRFGPQQSRDLIQACLDPDAWAQNNPITPSMGKIIIPTSRF